MKLCRLHSIFRLTGMWLLSTNNPALCISNFNRRALLQVTNRQLFNLIRSKSWLERRLPASVVRKVTGSSPEIPADFLYLALCEFAVLLGLLVCRKGYWFMEPGKMRKERLATFKERNKKNYLN